MLLSVLLAVGLLIYMYLSTSELFRVRGAVEIWAAAIEGKLAVASVWLYLYPVVVALGLSLMQYSSEIKDKRLKLTLHLPHSEAKIIGGLYGFGWSVMTLLSVLFFGVFYTVLSLYYPVEIMEIEVMRFLSYYLVAVGLYFLVAWVVVEPIWRRRIVSALSGAVLLWFFYGAQLTSLGFLALLALDILLVGAAYTAVRRFKDGAQK